jgi:hypothetical protein
LVRPTLYSLCAQLTRLSGESAVGKSRYVTHDSISAHDSYLSGSSLVLRFVKDQFDDYRVCNQHLVLSCEC